MKFKTCSNCLLSLLVFSLAANVSLPTPSAEAAINDGLIAHYAFDNTTGPVIDSVGSFNGTNFGAMRGVTGQIGNAFQFDGFDDFVDTLPVGVIPTTSTISLWIYPTDTTLAGNQVFGSVENASGEKDGIILNYFKADKQVSAYYVKDNIDSGEAISPNNSFPLNT